MKLLIFLFILGGCSAFDYDCLKGPEFWCKNFLNAQKCGKITECFMENKNQKNNMISEKPVQSGSYCGFCLVIGEILINKLESKQQFIEFLNKEICENLQGEMQPACKLLVSQFGPFVYDKIKVDLNPQIICKFLKFCETKSDFMREKSPFTKVGSSDMCSTCKEFLEVLHSLFIKITPEELKKLLENFFCTQLPSEFQSTCKIFVDGYTSQFYELIKSLLDGDRLCPLIHLCSTNNEPFRDSWSCSTCIDVVAVIKKDVINVSESDMENYVRSVVCAKLNVVERTICNAYVSSLVPTFYNDIHSSATPKQICNKNKLCQSSNIFSLDIPKLTDVKCETCRLVVSEIKKLISDPVKQDSIKQFLKNKICPIFQSETIQCQQLVNEYFSIILNFLISELDVNKTCHLMNFCSSNLANIECSACEIVMKEVIAIAFSNQLEHVVTIFVSTKLCPILGDHHDECVTLVNSYFPLLFSFARSTLNAKVLCVKLNMCTAFTKEDVKFTLENIRNGSNTCHICLLIVDQMKSLIKNPFIQETIEKLIKDLICPHMSNKNLCIKHFHQYFSMVIHVILEFLKPELCSDLHLCNSQQLLTKMSQPPLIINDSKKINYKECDLCSKFYEFLKSITGRKHRTNGVMGLISMCNQLGKSDKSKCLKQFQNLSAVVKSFNKSTSLGQFCTMTAMCSGDDDMIPNHRLGEHSCSWGPEFWCISQLHASSCGPGAVKHCEMNVWRKMPIKP